MCGSEYEIYDGIYICKNGHTLLLGHEIVEQQFTSASVKRSVKKEGTLKDLFVEIADLFGITSFYVYKLYFNIYPVQMNNNMFLALLYYSKRVECEIRGGIYMFADFKQALREKNVLDLINKRTKEYGLKLKGLKYNYVIMSCFKALRGFADLKCRKYSLKKLKRQMIRGRVMAQYKRVLIRTKGSGNNKIKTCKANACKNNINDHKYNEVVSDENDDNGKNKDTCTEDNENDENDKNNCTEDNKNVFFNEEINEKNDVDFSNDDVLLNSEEDFNELNFLNDEDFDDKANEDSKGSKNKNGKKTKYADKIIKMKKLFINSTRRNLGIFEKYYVEFLQRMDINSLPDEAILYFSKYIYILDLTDRIFIPEMVVAPFILHYIKVKRVKWPIEGRELEFDDFFEKILDKFCSYLEISIKKMTVLREGIMVVFRNFKNSMIDTPYPLRF